MQSSIYENEMYVRPYLTVAVSTPFPLHQHKHIELICVMSGVMDVILDGRSYSLNVGDIMLVSPYVLHSYNPPDKDSLPTLFKALFEPECFGTIGELLMQNRPKQPILRAENVKEHFPNLAEKLQNLSDNFHSVATPEEYVANFDELMHFVSVLIGISGFKPVDNKDDSLFVRAVKLCCKHYSQEKFSVQQLAAGLNVSASRLQQLFSQNLQLSVKEYITLLRISKAESLLQESNASIIDIAYICGYGTVRSFNRSFLSICGVTPTEYRVSSQNGTSQKNGRKILSNFELFYPDLEKRPDR